MLESIEQLQEKILALEEANKNLQDSLEKLQQAQSSYEQIIGDNNTSLLRSDMARMELEQIFSAYTDSMWVIREDGIVIRANNAMLEMLGKPADEVIGKKCSDLLDYGLCSLQECPLRNLKNQQTRDYDIEIAGDNSHRHFLLTTAPLITIDGTPGIVAQFKDFTGRKEAEEALQAANVALEKMALIDGLTQIANRRNFDDTLNKEWLRLRRTQQPISLLLGDIDFFKKYNDHYGHQAGDDCLKQVGAALSNSVKRPADLAARYGGEEFVLLLPEIGIEGALQVGQRAIDEIAKLKIPHEKSEASDIVSISIGAVSVVPTLEMETKDFIELADEALYQAKEQGRNRVLAAKCCLPESDAI